VVPISNPQPTTGAVSQVANSYNFVAIGDSLTAQWSTIPVPWPSRLTTNDPKLHLISNAGVPGDTTAKVSGHSTTGMLNRFASDVLNKSPDLVFIMGGTNDLGLI
jgi:lysophospholipase L1-like esterase